MAKSKKEPQTNNWDTASLGSAIATRHIGMAERISDHAASPLKPSSIGWRDRGSLATRSSNLDDWASSISERSTTLYDTVALSRKREDISYEHAQMVLIGQNQGSSNEAEVEAEDSSFYKSLSEQFSEMRKVLAEREASGHKPQQKATSAQQPSNVQRQIPKRIFRRVEEDFSGRPSMTIQTRQSSEAKDISSARPDVIPSVSSSKLDEASESWRESPPHSIQKNSNAPVIQNKPVVDNFSPTPIIRDVQPIKNVHQQKREEDDTRIDSINRKVTPPENEFDSPEMNLRDSLPQTIAENTVDIGGISEPHVIPKSAPSISEESKIEETLPAVKHQTNIKQPSLTTSTKPAPVMRRTGPLGILSRIISRKNSLPSESEKPSIQKTPNKAPNDQLNLKHETEIIESKPDKQFSPDLPKLLSDDIHVTGTETSLEIHNDLTSPKESKASSPTAIPSIQKKTEQHQPHFESKATREQNNSSSQIQSAESQLSSNRPHPKGYEPVQRVPDQENNQASIIQATPEKTTKPETLQKPVFKQNEFIDSDESSVPTIQTETPTLDKHSLSKQQSISISEPLAETIVAKYSVNQKTSHSVENTSTSAHMKKKDDISYIETSVPAVPTIEQRPSGSPYVERKIVNKPILPISVPSNINNAQTEAPLTINQEYLPVKAARKPEYHTELQNSGSSYISQKRTTEQPAIFLQGKERYTENVDGQSESSNNKQTVFQPPVIGQRISRSVSVNEVGPSQISSVQAVSAITIQKTADEASIDQGEPGKQEVNTEALAREVYTIIKRRLAIENERMPYR